MKTRLLALAGAAVAVLVVAQLPDNETTRTALVAIGTVFLALALIPAHGILLEFSRVPWRTSALGRVLRGKSESIAVILDLSVVAAILLLGGFGRPLWFEALRILALGYVALQLWRQWRAYRAIVRSRPITHPEETT